MAWSSRFAPVPFTDYVGSSGPLDSPIYLVGEGPGKEEARQRLPFVGPSGDELDRFLRECGWVRDRLFLTNLTRSYDPNRTPDASRVARESHHLVDELRRGRPRFVFSLGRLATRWFLGDVDMEQVWGIPHLVPEEFAHRHGLLSAWVAEVSPIVIPCYHPAAGLHSPDTQPLVQHSIRRAIAAVAGQIPVRDLTSNTDGEYGLADDQYLSELWDDYRTSPLLFTDTEGSEERPWGLSLTWEVGVGRVILANQSELLGRLRGWLEHKQESGYPATIVLHNALHDLPILARMDLDPWKYGCKVVDTMMMAYATQIEPQGLKPLAYRHAGLKMQTYEETVLPHVVPKWYTYLLQAATVDWPRPEPEVVFESDGTAKVYKPQPVTTRIRKILADFEADKRDKDGNPVDLDKRWRAIRPQDRAMVEAVLGPWPDMHLSNVPLSEAVPYSARDADATARVYYALLPILESANLTAPDGVLEIDHSVIRMVDHMGRRGMPIDPAYFGRLAVDLAQREDRVIFELSKLIGRRINPNSSDQVGNLLFDELGIESTKKTKGGKRSTNKKVVEGLRTQHQAVELVVNARELNKGRTSFAEPLSQQTSDRCRCRLRLTRVVSGRMAASDPNLMAIPVRSELGLEIRNGFRAPDGYLLGTWDLDQIEMRVMADESRDPFLLELFLTGRDIHSETASRCFGVPLSQVDKMKHRYPAKRVGFGVITGITGAGLLDQFRMAGITGWDEQQCDELIDAWFKVYPGVKSYMSNCRAEARRNGVVYDRWGRPRYLPGAQSSLSHIREEAERQSHSHKIQAGAQGIMKRAMAAIDQDIHQLQSEGYRVWPLMQIHDELILEFEEGLEGLLEPMVVDRLTRTTTLPSGVPLGAKGAFGRAWGELEK